MFQLEMIRLLQNGTLGLDGKSPPQRGVSMLGYVLIPTFLDDAGLATRYTTAMRQAAATSPDLPAFRRAAPTIPPSVRQQWWRHVAARVALTGLDRAVETNYRGLADRRLAAVALVVRMYAHVHGGQLPKSLDELVPKYLSAVPIDPTSAGQPIRYNGDDGDPDPRLWTLGENGRDDGGKDVVRAESTRWNNENTDHVVHLRRQPRPEPPRDELDPAATEPTSQPEAQ
jgi:hypothetical protein